MISKRKNTFFSVLRKKVPIEKKFIEEGI